MKRLAILCVALITLATILPPGHASAQQRNSGDRIVYATQMGANPQQTIKNTVTLTIDRTDKDGSAHALLTIDAPHMPQFKGEATVSPVGEILTKTNAAMPDIPKIGQEKAASKKMYEQEMAVAGGGMVTMYFRSFNAFAAAVGNRKKLKAGDTFKAAGFGPGDQITYKVTGREQHLGHDSFVVTMQSAPGAMVAISGQGYYDAAAHLVVALHTDESMQQQGAQSLDITLSQ